jgi:uncharacterized protein YlxW (UPF0749 family)
MRRYLSLIVLFAVVLLGGSHVSAQDTASAAQNAENLRAQLRDAQMKEAELQYRLNQLDFELKPENIERYFAGVGSVHPEELREQRRRQLQLEKDAINKQLQSLGESKIRLETAITRADALTYQQSALGSTSLMLTRVWSGHKSLVLTGVVMFGVLVGLTGLAVILRRRQSRAL